MLGNFEKAFALTPKLTEGWHKFTNNPRDPGGATYSGVTQRAWTGYCVAHGLVPSDVRTMSDAQALDIYREQYWRAGRCDELPAGVDLMVYDITVNSGPTRATRILQAAIGAKVDGHAGFATMAAARLSDPRATIRAMHQARMGFWRSLKTWSTFGRGWTNRETLIETHALVMVRPADLPSAPAAASPSPVSAPAGRGLFAWLFN